MRLYLYLFSLLLLGSLSAANNCNPFYYLTREYNTTCPGSWIDSMGTLYNIEINAKLIDCKTTPKQVASLIFSDPRTGWVVKRRQPEKEYYFEYAIRWEYPDSHCIVDLVPESGEDSWRMTDQNGIPNTPNEDLKKFALFKSYTRRFILDAKSPTAYRLAFRCTKDPAAQRPTQRVVVESIRFGQVDKSSNEQIVLFSPSFPNYDCWNKPVCSPKQPHKNATCVWVPTKEEAIPMWYHDGGWYMDEISKRIAVHGDLYVDNAISSMKAGGCIKPWHQKSVSVVLHPESRVVLKQSPECDFPAYNIVGKPKPHFEPQPFPKPAFGCKYSINADQVVKKSDKATGSLSLSAPKEAWSLDCPNKNSPKSEVDQTPTHQPITKKGHDVEIPVASGGNNATYMGLLVLLSLTICGLIAFRKYVGKPRRKVAP